jgi:hypothetical protein
VPWRLSAASDDVDPALLLDRRREGNKHSGNHLVNKIHVMKFISVLRCNIEMQTASPSMR